jgi:hypothetical protein
MPFLDKLLSVAGRNPRKAVQEICEILCVFVMDFPDEDELRRVMGEQAIDEAEAVRLRFTLSVANVALATAAMKAALKKDFSPLLTQSVLGKLGDLNVPVRVGDYVKDMTELVALNASVEVPLSAMLEKTRERKLMAGELFAMLGHIRGPDYASAIQRDASDTSSQGFPLFSRMVAVHYVGESLIDGHTGEFVNRLADSLNVIYRSGFNELVNKIKKLW